MDFKKIEKKWQDIWEKERLNYFNPKNIDKKYYCLEMFSYPSAAKLHLGHWYNYAPTDSFARYKKMKGYEVFQPMGFDAFGLPAENYAIKTGIHPKDSTLKNIENMEVTLKEMGAMFDWDAEIKTCTEEYYKWTQWIFLKLFENGLAYRKKAPVNWCPSCQTVLANEQVVDGECERCHTQVVKKDLTQWFFKITAYAEELLDGLKNLDWPEKTKAMQRNWIGKSTGAEIEFSTESGAKFKVFTTRADTLSGVSFIVMAPEHPLVKELTTDNKKEAVEKYIDDTSKSNEIERLSTVREKTGVFIGAYAINPLNGKKIPIWISDYVLLTYGTGIVMGVPGGDERDYAFAKKFDLPITRVTAGKPGEDELPYHGDGILVNSGEFDGLTVEEGQKAIVSKLAKDGIAEFKTNYRLRDWLVSRQRYWGAPIPIIHCPHCGEVAVPYEDLPVKLPYDVEFKPDGKSPLAKHEVFMHTKCPKCGADALRDPDTLDTFVCSSWYYLRYPDAKDSKMPFDPEIINKMLPVDKYVGGAEHACMHLLYSRFITKALRDMGYLKFDEPFKSLVHQGVILGPDGARMSKSRGNVISPDPYVEKYGSDVLRLYLLFGFSYREGGPWDDNGIKAITKFYDRVERLSQKVISLHANKNDKIDAAEKDLLYTRNYTVRCMTRDIEDFSFNTATARLMEYLNALNKYDTADGEKNIKLFKECFSDFILLLAPFAPHFSEEIWEQLGNKKSVFLSSYPEVEEKWLIKSENEVAVQVNSKIKTKIMLPAEATEDEIKELLLNNEALKPFISGKEIKKLIIIPKRLINIIV
ncbi:MAG TPA: leucine--tRNA ligase [Clostridiales bacterium]|nr:leucine--tRNA ligase [Clostridiales bacterium]